MIKLPFNKVFFTFCRLAVRCLITWYANFSCGQVWVQTCFFLTRIFFKWQIFYKMSKSPNFQIDFVYKWCINSKNYTLSCAYPSFYIVWPDVARLFCLITSNILAICKFSITEGDWATLLYWSLFYREKKWGFITSQWLYNLVS